MKKKKIQLTDTCAIWVNHKNKEDKHTHTHTNIASFHIHRVSRVSKLIEIMGSHSLVGTKFLYRMMSKFWKGIKVMIVQHCQCM